MRNFVKLVCATALPLALTLTGCSQPKATTASADLPHQPKAMTVFTDISISNGPIGNARLAEREADLVASEFGKFQIGDGARIVLVGTPSADHAAGPLPIVTDYKNRVPAAQKQLRESIRTIFDTARTNGADGSTSIQYAMEMSKPVCTPGSRIVLLSDGGETDNLVKLNAITSGKPIAFEKPPAQYLKGGCSVTFYGFGVSADQGGVPQVLSNPGLRDLRNAWIDYLTAAGVNEADIDFVSIL